jgi:dephospho-CoA kinase
MAAVKVLGVTGTIGSGKSTVCRLLSEMGCPVIDADLEAHETYSPGTSVHRAIVAGFGEGILDARGAVDRAALGKVVFADPHALERLNAIVHPATRRRVARKLAHLRALGHEWAAVEATLIIEAGWRDLVDRLWVVAAPEEDVVERLRRDRGQAETRTRERLAAQMAAREMMTHADDVIYNDGDLESLRERVERLWRDLPQPILPG